MSRILLTLAATAWLAASPARAEGPEALVGSWTWTWKDGEGTTHKHVLDVERAGGKVSARERFDELAPIEVDDLKLDGDQVIFSVKRPDRMAEYKGKLLGGKTINGIVNVVVDGRAEEFQWTAEKALPAKR